MRKKIMLAAICVAVLAAVGGGAWWWLVKRPVDMVKQRVAEALNDPDSAKFRFVEANPKTGGGCGEVNARNRMGGYVGFTAFILFADGEVRFGPPEVSSTEGLPRFQEYVQKLENFVILMNANCASAKK